MNLPRFYSWGFLLWAVSATGITAEIAPKYYKEMRDNAAEQIKIHVKSVDTSWCFFFCKAQSVSVTATVTKVFTSAQNLSEKNTIEICYKIHKKEKGFVGPAPVPLLKKNTTYKAYLQHSEDKCFVPAARGQSFQKM